ncbi:hypothetical protein AMJ39_06180 [candidate division TA06 bacterium DG_24]|uniref:Glycerol-3-phosphate acyltransferase n=1 Tax=candidate division TA06 bacterium DG_24 TaxID=1703770 RepID=A0A0S7WS85_UNCT6|nr:MAG: hypothetical protein AMJ39_06180 [candidate division TA06 bacterium DG_24]
MIAVGIVASFLIGSIPFGFIVAKLWAGVDIREHGSGNIGFANVAREVGFRPGLVVLVLDIAKGFLPVLAAYAIWGRDVAVHVVTPFLRWRGGKGVATALGAFAALDPPAAAVALVVWIAAAAIWRYVAVASMSLAWTLFVVITVEWVFGRAHVNPLMMAAALVVAIGIVITHRTNIRRLGAGIENKISLKRGGGDA